MAWDISQVNDWAEKVGRAGPTASAATSRAVTKAAARVYREAFAAAPVGETGDLRDSLTNRPLGPFAAVVEATEYYAAFLEYGTVNMAPQPFMIPAAQGAEEELTRDISAAGTAPLL